MAYLLDTNVISGLLNGDRRIIQKLQEVQLLGVEVFISCITYYEVLRGLIAVNASRKMLIFSELCKEVPIVFIDNIEIIERAAEIHADLKLRGTPIQEADILIAATAITRGLILVSNDSDMLRVRGVTVENWFAT